MLESTLESKVFKINGKAYEAIPELYYNRCTGCAFDTSEDLTLECNTEETQFCDKLNEIYQECDN